MGRAPCCDKATVKKGPWSPEEDAKLKAYIEQHGTGSNWIALPQKIGLKRCGKSCRLRWLNYLRPNIKHGGFSEEEDNIICSLYINIGSRWSIIAAQLPGRTDNDIKNYWNTKLKKKLLGKQRKADQATARRAAAATVKREPNNKSTLDDNNNMTNYNNFQTTPYWPDLTPVLAPPPPPPPPCSLNYHDQELLRNTLVKLGGRFSEDQPNLQYPFENFLPFAQTHDQFTQNTYLENFLSLDQNQQIRDQELIFGNDQQQYGAFSGFYGSDIVDGTSGSSSAESSNNITSSLGNYNDNNYPQIVPQVSSFDDSSFFGPEL